MKKSNVIQKKGLKNPNASEKNQKKINSFFTKIPESQGKNDSTKKDVIFVTEIKKDSSTDHNVNKKRKRSESSDSEPHVKIKNICYGNVEESFFDNSLKVIDSKKENCEISKDCSSDSLNICNETIEEFDNSLIEDLTDDLTIIDDEETTSSNINNINDNDNKSQCNKSLNMVELNQMFNKMNNCEELNAEDFDEIFDTDWNLDSQINLNSLERCEVINLEKNSKSMILKVQHADLKSFGTVMCLGYWKDLQIKEGDVVMIQAKKESQNWIVDNDHGYIVIKPDVLISSTTVVGGFYCSRKAVLSEKFGRIESLPYFLSNQMPLVIGKIVHTLLQKSIVEGIYKIDDISKMAEIELQSKDTIYMLYGSESTYEKLKNEVLSYVPQISKFLQHYVHDIKEKTISNDNSNFQGKISEVHDIEENIWLPKLGLKGKIDITAEVKIHSHKKVMPIEIKTGRSSFSLEHRGQVILYIMMMALMGQETDSGLLLYLKNNKMREITCGRAEKRDLILLRNTLVDYFTRTKNIIFSDNSEDIMKNMPLPEPINHYTGCLRCPYNNLCCAYLKNDDTMQLSESHGLVKLSKEILNVFDDNHIDFIFKWVSLLQMEENMQAEKYNIKDIWTLTPEKREIKGNCISNLKVIGKVIAQCDRFKHIFVRTNNQAVIDPNISTEFVENEYVIVSTDTRINISSGFIIQINQNSITLLLNSNITKRNTIGNFHIDKYNSMTFLSTLFANIGGLLYDNEICGKLRSIVIDKKPATFLQKLPRSVVFKSATILQHLNEVQQRAILKCLAANEYVLIKGMPGTGKTETIVTLIEVLYKLGVSIIVTSHTHSAIDNILLKLSNKNIDFIRLGSSHSINPLLKNKSEEYLTSGCSTIEELESVYASKNIVGVTCYGSNHVFFEKRTFDVCIVDESTQVTQPAILGPLYNANKFILVGDPNQLPPVVRSKTAKNLGAEESLFEKLDSVNNTISLTLQYRMNKTIMNLINKLTYNDQLKAGNKSIENATFVSPNTKIRSSNERWVKTVLSPALDDSVIILNTGCIREMTINFIDKKHNIKTDETCTNIWEAALILYLLKTLFQMGIECKQIGIIAPYKAQVILIKSLVDSEIEINTVDQYQGRDKDIIFYSCTKSVQKKSNEVQDTGILEDQRRLTVAVTRAKHKLIIIADKDTMSQYTPFKQCFNIVQEKYIINIQDACYNFTWEPIINSLKNNMSLQSNE